MSKNWLRPIVSAKRLPRQIKETYLLHNLQRNLNSEGLTELNSIRTKNGWTSLRYRFVVKLKKNGEKVYVLKQLNRANFRTKRKLTHQIKLRLLQNKNNNKILAKNRLLLILYLTRLSSDRP